MKSTSFRFEAFRGPLTYFAAVLCIVFVSEAVVMYLLAFLVPPDVNVNVNVEAFLDAAMLTLICAPILWGLLIRPLRRAADRVSHRFWRLVNDSGEAIVVIHPDGRLDVVNNAARDLLNIKGRDVSECFVNEFLPSVAEQLAAARNASSNWRSFGGETVVVGPIGEIAIEYTAHSIQDSDYESVTVFIRDISERKRAEEEAQRAHSLQIEAAHLAGKAEIASSVLHNVGNTLTSIGVLTEKLSNDAQASRIAGLQRVTALMDEHQSDLGVFLTLDPKGKQVPTYLQGLAAKLSDEHKTLQSDLNMLLDHVRHAGRIVAAQQSFARSPGIEEATDIESLIDNAVEIAKASMNRHSVQIEKECRFVPLVLIDRHKVIQILVNLLTNAKDAVKNNAADDRLVHISMDITEDDRIRICVRDNGQGIHPKNIARIFTQGFTTKTDGHGFGLHYCANAAVELDGRLTVHSEGVGQGAEFVLDLPLTAVESGVTV
ncbi:MAG: ATP-binding protein [Pirellulales bacterium]